MVSSNFATLLFGFVLLFIYIFLVLGNFNWIEQRAFLSIAGMLVIGLALGSCYGLGFYLSVSFNDMCPVIPFLLLGIGVDDMFVIVQVVIMIVMMMMIMIIMNIRMMISIGIDDMFVIVQVVIISS